MNARAPLALVTGGSRGIGRAIAVRLAEAGFDIWLCYHSAHEPAATVQSIITAMGRRCELLPFDVRDFEGTRAALEERAAHEPPEVVVLNAGVARDNLLALMTLEEWHSVVSTTLDGFFNVTRAVLPPMLARRRGRIVAISSISGETGQAGQVNYSAAKAGLCGAVRALAREVGKRGIFVNAVAPGLIETDMTSALPLDKILPLIPLSRAGTVDDVASLVHYLCTEAHMYIHGQTISVNGGLTM